jgi:hypothetical protein
MAKITFDYFEFTALEEPLKTVSGEDIPTGRKGKYLRIDGTTGAAVYGNGSSAGEVGNLRGLALSKQHYVGDPVSLLRHGYVDIGNELDSLDYGAAVYIDDDDGALATTSGDSATQSVAGRVAPIAQHDGTLKKVLLLDLR